MSDPESTIATAPVQPWLTPGRFGALLALLIFAAYPEVVLGRQTFFFRDFGYFGYPLAYYHKQSFLHGEIPLWNPLSNCGLPFLAQWNTLVLYPGSLIYLLLPLSWSLGMFCLIHQWLGGFAMFWLARRWTGSELGAAIAGVGYAFGGLTLNSLMWPNNIAALGWLPFVVGGVERGWREGGKALVMGTLLGAVQMLSGAPEVILFTWVIIGVMWLVALAGERTERLARVWRLGLMVAWVAGLCAAQLFPFFDLLTHSQRDKGFADAYGAMPAWGWANLLVPTFRCFTKFFGVIAQYDQYWTSSYYAGIGVLALALLAAWRVRERKVWALTAIIVASLLMALGNHGFLYPLVHRLLPQSGYMRYPIKFVVLADVCLPLLAAYGVQSVCAAVDRKQLARIAAGVALSFGLLIAGIAWFDLQYPLFRQTPFPAWHNGITREGLLVAMLGMLLFHQWRTPGVRSRGMLLVAILLFAVDGLTHVPLQNPTMPLAGYQPALVKLEPAPRFGIGRAMVSPAAEAQMHQFAAKDPLTDYLATRAGLFVNSNLLDDYAKPDGLYSLYLRGPDRVHRVVLYNSTNLPPERASLLDFLGINQITAPGKVFDWEIRPTALPLITAGQQPVFVDDEKAFYTIGTREFQPAERVYLPPQAETVIAAKTRTAAKIEMPRIGSQELKFTVNAPAPTVAVIAQAYYHRWQALVDGAAVPLWKANYAYQAVVVPAGQHEVKIVYVDWPFRIGVIVSLLSVAALVLAWRWRKSAVKLSESSSGIQ